MLPSPFLALARNWENLRERFEGEECFEDLLLFTPRPWSPFTERGSERGMGGDEGEGKGEGEGGPWVQNSC